MALGADRGTVRWTTPDTSLTTHTARFADPLPLLYLYRREGNDALFRIVDRPEGLAAATAAIAKSGRPVDLAPLPWPTDPVGDGRVQFDVVQTPAGPASVLRVLDPAAGLLVESELMGGRPLGLLEVVRAGSPALLALSLGSDERLVLTAVPAGREALPVSLDVATPQHPWAAVALPAGDGPSDIAVFGVDDEGRVVAHLVDTESGATGPVLSFGRRLTPVDAVALPDLYPDGSPELAMLGDADDGRVAGVLIKETGSGATVGRFRLSPSYQPLALHYLPAGDAGQGDLLIVGLRANGALGLQRRSLGGGRAARAGPTLPLKARYVPTDTALLQLGEDGRVVLALAGVDWRGGFRLEVRDGVSGDLLLDSALP